MVSLLSHAELRRKASRTARCFFLIQLPLEKCSGHHVFLPGVNRLINEFWFENNKMIYSV